MSRGEGEGTQWLRYRSGKTNCTNITSISYHMNALTIKIKKETKEEGGSEGGGKKKKYTTILVKKTEWIMWKWFNMINSN